MNKKKIGIIIAIAAIVAAAGVGTAYYIDSNKEIETVSATINMDSETIYAGADGKISKIKIKNFNAVKPGDEIAEILTIKKDCPKELDNNKQKKAVADYKDAAIMYKDGVITKEEYDSSLEKYKDITEEFAECSGKEPSHVILSEGTGILVLADVAEGTEVKKDSILATVVPEHAGIKAYFSPKYKKRIKVGHKASINVIKYPEKTFTATVTKTGKIETNGYTVYLTINEDTADLNIKNDDAAIVKMLKKDKLKK